eukprot:m51a1_g3901 putative endoglucanase precursor (endo- -beta-glucanase) (451) ;mRNA; f:116291-117643
MWMLLVLEFAAACAAAPLQLTGVSLAGAEFNEGAMPGTYNTDYLYPTTTEVDFFVSSKGMNFIRIPFRWDRLQRTLGADFDQEELSRLTTLVNYATGKGAHVLLDPHNYAEWQKKVVGSADLPNELFADFWTRLANVFKGNQHVVFGLMNEPRNMPTEQWFAAAKAAYSAIRKISKTHLVLIPGNGYTGAHSWQGNWYGTSNAKVWVDTGFPKDPNMMVEVHQYLDGDHSGRGEQCDPASQQTKTIEGFTAWARTQGVKAVLGEFGAGNNQNCKEGIEAILSYMERNSDVWYGWSWWAAGPRWGNYFMSIESTPGNEKPQLGWILPHLNKGGVTPIPSSSSKHESATASSSERAASSHVGPQRTDSSSERVTSSHVGPERADSSSSKADSTRKASSSVKKDSSKKAVSSSKAGSASRAPTAGSEDKPARSAGSLGLPAITVASLLVLASL